MIFRNKQSERTKNSLLSAISHSSKPILTRAGLSSTGAHWVREEAYLNTSAAALKYITLIDRFLSKESFTRIRREEKANKSTRFLC